MSAKEIADRTPRPVLIEAVYLAMQQLTHRRAASGASRNAALSPADSAVAQTVAAELIDVFAGQFSKPVANWSPTDRSYALANLYELLRSRIDHSDRVKRQADAALEELRHAEFA